MKSYTIGSLSILAVTVVAVVACICFRSVPVEAAYPVERAKTSLFRGMRTRVRAWFRAQSAAVENVRLKREVASLVMVSGDLERLEAENARLRRALDYAARSPERWISAEVLSEGGAAAGVGKTLRLNKGTLAGIVKGAVVAVPDGLVGRVTFVSPHTATVTLVTDASIQVACEVESSTSPRLRGILSGGEGQTLALKYLKRVDGVPPCSRVVTSGLGGVFPKGLEVGTLQSVHPSGEGCAVVGDVLSSVDFSALEDVFVRREK